MTEFMIALTLITGILTAQTTLLGRMQTTYRLLDDNMDDACSLPDGPWSVCLPPRLDHAAPGHGRTPRAFCLVLDHARLPPDLAAEAPCN